LVDLGRGELAMERGEPEKAIPSLVKALDDYTARGTVAYVAWTMSRLSKAHRLAGHPAEAVDWGRRGLQYCAQHHLAKETQDNEQELYQAYAALGDKTAAYDHLQRYLALKDSSTGVVASGIVGTTVLRSEMARQARVDSLLRAERERSVALEQRSAAAQQRYIRNITLLTALAALIVAVGLWSRLRYTRRSRAEIQREKDISESLLLNILPTEVAQELKERGASEARLMDHVTVLFTDFKDFTAMSEQLSPRDLVKDIHECFSAFDGIMERHGIEKIKTIGDAYMAVGGLPTANTTHAVDVVKAALEVRDFIAEGKARKIAQGLPYFEVRIGVHTGPVVAGVVGVKKFQYDIWGDTVNTASRLESSGEVGRVNISEVTYALVKDEPGFLFTPRGKVQAKGKGELEMYYVEPRPTGSC
ncbi:MAG TPA: adenylate/guanylate cyclase domain-containing protein, partial [Flavobacteriales bacterium]|nr:adenylate/guanylate cyclase domain-containing protein [Flavobacteriales bacterium]